jgi:hypothetical protein
LAVVRLVSAEELPGCGSGEGFLDGEVEFLEGFGVVELGEAEERASSDSSDSFLGASSG